MIFVTMLKKYEKCVSVPVGLSFKLFHLQQLLIEAELKLKIKLKGSNGFLICPPPESEPH